MLDVLGGGSNEYISWQGSTGLWKVDGDDCQITKLLIDPNSIKTGWGKIEKGAAPDFAWAEVPGTKCAQPSEAHKPAFSVQVYVTTRFGASTDGVREWKSNGRASRDAIKGVWADIHNSAAANNGKWAVVEVESVERRQYGPANVAVPMLRLTGWAPVPSASTAAAAPPPPPAPVVAASEEFF